MLHCLVPHGADYVGQPGVCECGSTIGSFDLVPVPTGERIPLSAEHLYEGHHLFKTLHVCMRRSRHRVDKHTGMCF